MTVLKVISAGVLLVMAVAVLLRLICDRPATWPDPKPPRLQCWGSKRR